MKSSKVTVLNTDGTVLLSGDDPSSAPAGRMATLEHLVNSEIQDNIRRTLTPYLGVNNFEVSVVARLNTDKVQTNETVFNPDQKVERSVRAVKEAETTQNRGAQKPTTAQQNMPDQRVRAEGGETSSADNQRREELTNYEISSRTTQTVSDGYAVKNLSIAVLVNRARLQALSDGSPAAAAEKKPEAQITEIEQLVASAAGVNLARGDQLKVAAVGFVNDGQPLEPVPSLNPSEILMRQSGTLINAATILIVGCLLIWFGLRPAVTAILARPSEAEIEAALPAPDHVAVLEALQAPSSEPPVAPNLLENLTERMIRSPVRRL
jgi:flagellar M-ring protein FliF